MQATTCYHPVHHLRQHLGEGNYLHDNPQGGLMQDFPHVLLQKCMFMSSRLDAGLLLHIIQN